MAIQKKPRSQSPQSSDSDSYLWEVAEILAERTSIGGEEELLIVWKTSWVPKKNLMADGPVMRQFNKSRKCKFTSTTGDIKLAVVPDPTQLQLCSNCKCEPVAREVLCGFQDWCERCDQSLFSTQKPRSQSPQSSDSDGYVWEVAEILAERTLIGGDAELLVVWKTSWVPKKNLMADGPVMRQFNKSRKCKFTSTTGDIKLAVEPGTMLQRDSDAVELHEVWRQQQQLTKQLESKDDAGDGAL
jgi:hypothetical protein